MARTNAVNSKGGKLDGILTEFKFRDGRFTELVVVEGTGEFSPETIPKASNGEYFLRGWGRSGGFCEVSNPDGRGSEAGTGLAEEGILSGELDTGARVSLFVMPPDLFLTVEASRGTGAYPAFLKGSSRFLNSGEDVWGFGGRSSKAMGGVLASNGCAGPR